MGGTGRVPGRCGFGTPNVDRVKRAGRWLLPEERLSWARFFAFLYRVTSRRSLEILGVFLLMGLILSALVAPATVPVPTKPLSLPPMHLASFTLAYPEIGFCALGSSCQLCYAAPSSLDDLCAAIVAAPAGVSVGFADGVSIDWSGGDGEVGGPSNVTTTVVSSWDDASAGTLTPTAGGSYSGVSYVEYESETFEGTSGDEQPVDFDQGFVSGCDSCTASQTLADSEGTTSADEPSLGFVWASPASTTGTTSSDISTWTGPTNGDYNTCILSCVGVGDYDYNGSSPASSWGQLSGRAGITQYQGTEPVADVSLGGGTTGAVDAYMGEFFWGAAAGEAGVGVTPASTAPGWGGAGCTGSSCTGTCTENCGPSGTGTGTGTGSGDCTGWSWTDPIGDILNIIDPVSAALCGLQLFFIPSASSLSNLETTFGISSTYNDTGNDAEPATDWMAAMVSTVATWPTGLVSDVQDDAGNTTCPDSFTFPGTSTVVSACSMAAAATDVLPEGMWSGVQAVLAVGIGIWAALAVFGLLRRVLGGS